MVAQEVKKVPAAPGRVAASETIPMCKLENLSAKWIFMFHTGETGPGKGCYKKVVLPLVMRY